VPGDLGKVVLADRRSPVMAVWQAPGQSVMTIPSCPLMLTLHNKPQETPYAVAFTASLLVRPAGQHLGYMTAVAWQ
jgi:hypothetical protein